MSKELVGTPYDPLTTFFEKGDDGLIRGYNIISGDCILVAGDHNTISRMPSELVEITREDGTKFLAQKNIALDEKALAVRGGKLTPLLRDVICSRIASGESLKKISNESDMPSFATFQRWLREDKDFADAIELARQARAEFFAERTIEEAEGANETVAGVAKAKLVVETLWKAAEHDKPQRFGAKNKAITFNAPVSFILDTGIRRKGDPGYIADETQKLKDARAVTELSQNETGGATEVGGLSADIQVSDVSQDTSKPN